MHNLQIPIATEAAAPTVPGCGRLRVSRAGVRSRVTRAFASSPLRLLAPRNHGHAAWVYTSTYGGGLVDGDSIALDVQVEQDAAALITTQSATRVYRSPGGTSFHGDYTVGPGALLVVAPDPLVPFAGAAYRQVQRFELEPAANLVAVDWFTSGRHASGERWGFERYESGFAVRRAGRLVVADAIRLDRRDGNIAGRMGRFDALLTAVILGPLLDSFASAVVRAVGELPVERGSDLLVSASSVDGHGCVLRIAGSTAEGVWRAAADYVRFVPELLGDDPWSRKR